MELVIGIFFFVIIIGLMQALIAKAEGQGKKKQEEKIKEESRIEIIGGIPVKIGPIRATRSETAKRGGHGHGGEAA